MRAILCAILLIIPISSANAITRCGWLDNPSPANVFLTDKDGDWTVSWQGGGSSVELPNFGNEWVLSGNASYGYGCACVEGETDREPSHLGDGRFSKVRSIKALPLKTCDNDKSLPPFGNGK